MQMGLIYYVKIFSLNQTFAGLCLSFYVYFPCFLLPVPDMFTACLWGSGIHVLPSFWFCQSLSLGLWIYFTSSSSWGRINRLRGITCILFRLHKCEAQLRSGSATKKLPGSSICLIPFPFSISVCLSSWSLYSKLFFPVRSRLWDHRGLNGNSQWDYNWRTRDGRMGSKSEEFSNWV